MSHIFILQNDTKRAIVVSRFLYTLRSVQLDATHRFIKLPAYHHLWVLNNQIRASVFHSPFLRKLFNNFSIPYSILSSIYLPSILKQNKSKIIVKGYSFLKKFTKFVSTFIPFRNRLHKSSSNIKIFTMKIHTENEPLSMRFVAISILLMRENIYKWKLSSRQSYVRVMLLLNWG